MRTASILNVVAACKGNVAENIGRYVDGETLTAQGEEYQTHPSGPIKWERMYVMKNLFKTKFDVAVIVLIPACIGINYLGKLFASVLKLPLWLDSIGTCIGGCLGGPIIGAICGAANNLIYGFSAGDNITLIYALTSLGIGAAAGIMARLGFMKSFPKAIITACVAGFVAVAISTPLNVLFWGGTTGNVWGDAVFAATQAANMPVFLGSLLDEVVVDVPDKLITLIMVFFILKGLPNKLTTLYEVNSEIETLE